MRRGGCWARRKRKAQGADDAHNRAELGITLLSKRLVEALTVQASLLRNLAHAAGARNETKRVAHEIRVTRFKRRCDISNLPLFGVEIGGSIKSCSLWHHNDSASFRARLMSCCCVRLSPPHNRITICVPRGR